MNTSEILEVINQEILKLQQARALLADAPATRAAEPVPGKRRGRPKGSVNKKAEVIPPVVVKRSKRTMSAEGKAGIVAAQKARWAAQKKTSKPAANKIVPKSVKKTVLAAKPAAKKSVSKVSKKAAVAAKKSVINSIVEA